MTQSPQQVARLLADFNRYFTSANSVDVPARVSVPTAEWRALHEAICNAVLAGQKAVEEERERCRSRAVQIVGWHRNDYNRQQIDAIVAELRNALPGNPPPTTTHAA